MIRRPMIMIVPAAIALICLSPGAMIRSKIEQSVAAKAPELLGPAKSYSVDVSAGIFDLIRCKVKQIDIKGRDVRLQNGVVVDRLNVRLTGVHFKADQTITGISKTEFTAALSEANLRDYLRASRSDMSDADVSLADGKLVLKARPRVLAIKTPVRIEGTLQIEQGRKLNIELSKASAIGIRVPGFVRGRIQRSINPVLDTEQMGMDAKLTKVQITNGEIVLSGIADVKKALVAAKC